MFWSRIEKSLFTALCDLRARVQNKWMRNERLQKCHGNLIERPCFPKIGLDLSWSKCNVDSVTSTGVGPMKGDRDDRRSCYVLGGIKFPRRVDGAESHGNRDQRPLCTERIRWCTV